MASPIRLPIRGADELGDAVRHTIRAFHGSPHDFDRFDASKIGTGEGAQAYGHGLYFAGNEDVAYDYRERLGRALTKQEQDEYNRLVNEQQRISALLRDHYRQHPINVIPPPEQAVERMRLQHLSKQAERTLIAMHAKPGHMYEVEIAHPESALLDWDAPISRQPKVVQKVFGDFAVDELGDGGRIYRDIATRHGESFDDDMTGVLANLEASKELLAEGIPGIRYLDQSSRRAGKGTSNYVMFPGTEDQIRVLRKYGLLAPMAAAGTMGEE